MSYTDDELIAISALQHYSYCPRQCALIHVEQVFDENLHTMRGHAVHAKVNQPESVMEGGVRVERALPLLSREFGLIGKADVVEFFPDGTPYPVEYKHGRYRSYLHDDIQLAAQAICLEEMTGKAVFEGAIYQHGSRRRRTVEINRQLRNLVVEYAEEIRKLLRDTTLPQPVNDRRCRNCSLIDACQPEAVSKGSEVHALRKRLYEVRDS